MFRKDKINIIETKNAGNVHLRSHVEAKIEFIPSWSKTQKLYALDLLYKEAEKLDLRVKFDA